MIIKEIITASKEETQALAYKFGQLLPAGSLLTLSGQLGAGKTTFTQGLAKGLGIKRTVTSPTFNLLKIYKGRLPLYHIDAYRLENISQDLGFEEYIDGDGICVIEWSNFIRELLPESCINIDFSITEDFNRKLVISAIGNENERIVEEICTL